MSSYMTEYNSQHLYIWVTCVANFCYFWGMQELMERKFGMEPIIRCTNLLESQSTSPAMLKINKRLTRQLDHNGYFRIQTRASVLYVKAIWAILAAIASIYFVFSSDFFYQHFILLNADTVYYMPYQHFLVSFLVNFFWELMSNKYGKLKWTVIIHHWLTIFAAMMGLLCFYSPFTTWYGLTAVILHFPTLFVLGFRVTHSRQYPKFARKLFKFCIIWDIFIIFLNMCGQIFMIVYGSIMGKVHYLTVIIITGAMCGWLWDDYLLIRAMIEFSKQRYENARIHRIPETKEVNVCERDMCKLQMNVDIKLEKSEILPMDGFKVNSSSTDPKKLNATETELVEHFKQLNMNDSCLHDINYRNKIEVEDAKNV